MCRFLQRHANRILWLFLSDSMALKFGSYGAIWIRIPWHGAVFGKVKNQQRVLQSHEPSSKDDCLYGFPGFDELDLDNGPP